MRELTPKERKEEQAAYEEELERHNAICKNLRERGKVLDTGDTTPPPLNPDGSLKDEEETKDE